MTEEIKPPLGIQPRGLYDAIRDDQRVNEILLAIGLYYEQRMPIPREWMNELEDRGLEITK